MACDCLHTQRALALRQRQRQHHLIGEMLINGGVTGLVLVVRASDDSVTITATENGNMALGAATRALDDTDDVLVLYYDGSTWLELSFADNS